MVGRAVAAVKMLRPALSTISSSTNPLQICVVGSGPAGFYTAEELLKRFSEAKVDILDRLPTPFGLVRSGVAPDHPETKVVINQFTRVASSEKCSFFGNVCLDRDITLKALRSLYHVVVLAYGAESDRSLGIPGEGLSGVHSAREFVWWYNGHPDCVDLQADLKQTGTAVIFGQGNVALDAARILLRPVNELATTDISEHAISALRESNIRRVYLIGRRGPVQAACTAKEMREILGDAKTGQRAVGTGEFEELHCGLVFKSIGYKSLPVQYLPFDHSRGVLPNERGRVVTTIQPPAVDSGLYVVGWLKRGPTGIIVTNLVCAEETVESIVEDVQRGVVDVQSTRMLGGLGLKGLLEEKNVQVVSFKEWQKIDRKELERGKLKGKVREKILVIQEMISM